MADVFKRFITNVTTTDLTTVFTVPTANVAATPPVPVSTFIVKTINTHNYDGSNAVTVNVDHNNGSADLQIFQIDVAASDFDFSKIDTYIDVTENDVFTDDELEQLENEYVILD